MTEMTEATRAFFQREDVRAFVDAVRVKLPGAKFAMDGERDRCPGFPWLIVLDASEDRWNYRCLCAKHRPADACEGISAGGGGRVQYAKALRAGRALLDQPAPAEPKPVDAFKQNLRAEVDGLHRQADLAEQQLATGLWGMNQGASYGDFLAGNRIANNAQVQQAALQGALQAQRRSVGWDTQEVGYDFTLRSCGHITSPEPTRAEPERAVCSCGQEIPPRTDEKFTDNICMPPDDVCADCFMASPYNLNQPPLDERIAAARPEPVARERWDWDARDAEYEL